MVADKAVLRIGTLSPEQAMCRNLVNQIDHPGAEVSSIVAYLRTVIADNGRLWKSLGHKHFINFVTSPYPNGLGRSKDQILWILDDHANNVKPGSKTEQAQADLASLRADVQRLLAEPLRPHGVRSDSYNITICEEEKPDRGTSSGYALRVLESKHHDLYEEVKAGRMSPHKAAVQAGIRKKTVTVEASPSGFARHILRHFTQDELDALIAALGQDRTS